MATGDGMTPPEPLPDENPMSAKPLPIGPGVGVGEGVANGFEVADGDGLPGDGLGCGVLGACELGCPATAASGAVKKKNAMYTKAKTPVLK